MSNIPFYRFALKPSGIRIRFKVYAIGRITQPIRSKFNEKVEKLRREYRNALKDQGLKDAFEKLVSVWSSEMGAITYAETISMFDLMILTAILEENSRLMDLNERINTIEKQC